MKEKNSRVFSLIYPFLGFLISAFIYAILYFVIFPFIDSLIIDNNVFDFSTFLYFMLVHLMAILGYSIHLKRVRKAMLGGLETKVIITCKKQLRGVDGPANYFYGLEKTDNVDKAEFYFNIYPFTKTKIESEFSIVYNELSNYNKGYIAEDEKLFRTLFYTFSVVYSVIAIVICFLVTNFY
jgi:hypothetical protein